MSKASVECSQPRPCSGGKTLRRSGNRGDTDNVVLIDVDCDGFDNVIIIDVPESLRNKFRSSKVLGKDRKGQWPTVICLDDDESNGNNNAHSVVKVGGNLNNGASTSKRSHPASGSVESSSKGVVDDCEFIQENISPVKLSKGKRTYSGKGSSESDYLDCELMEDSFCVREQWEKAYWKRKCDTRNGQSGVGHSETVFSECQQNVNVTNEHGRHEENTFAGKDRRDGLTEEPPYGNAHHLGSHHCGDSSSFHNEDRRKNSLSANEEILRSVSKNGMQYDKDHPLHGEDCHATLNLNGCIIGDREKLKETDEYKKALEEELASRQQALRTQAEEAQNLRRLRKREKAENMRLLDMERRQKQRIEEIRETQKKDVEDMNMKEAIRAAVRNDLNQLEQTCHDMASLLQGLGVLAVGSFPLLNEVRLAYKRALLTFHPDRASRSDIRQQVEAEEKFKLISRMKEKFLPI